MLQILKGIVYLVLTLFVGNHLDGADCSKFKVVASKSQKEDISYIVKTLASHSSLSLLGYKKSLEEAGSRVKTVSSFSFFAVVLSDPGLKADLNKLSNGNSIQFKKFCNGFTKDFQNQATKPCFETTFEGFCKEAKLDSAKIKPIFMSCYKASKKGRGTPFAPFLRAISK